VLSFVEGGVVVASEEIRWPVSCEDDIRALYQACFDEVYRAAARLAGRDRALAEDLVQDAFVSLVRRARAGTLDEVGVGWLVTAVRNMFVDHLRRASAGDRAARLVSARAVRKQQSKDPAMTDPHIDALNTSFVAPRPAFRGELEELLVDEWRHRARR
jgi:RNA polymerase sigma factor (sigma-70 family)